MRWRFTCRLASHQLDQKTFAKDEKLVQMLKTKIIALAGVERQAGAVEDLCGNARLP